MNIIDYLCDYNNEAIHNKDYSVVQTSGAGLWTRFFHNYPQSYTIIPAVIGNSLNIIMWNHTN